MVPNTFWTHYYNNETILYRCSKIVSMSKAALERCEASLLALSKAVQLGTRFVFDEAASENRVAP